MGGLRISKGSLDLEESRGWDVCDPSNCQQLKFKHQRALNESQRILQPFEPGTKLELASLETTLKRILKNPESICKRSWKYLQKILKDPERSLRNLLPTVDNGPKSKDPERIFKRSWKISQKFITSSWLRSKIKESWNDPERIHSGSLIERPLTYLHSIINQYRNNWGQFIEKM